MFKKKICRNDGRDDVHDSVLSLRLQACVIGNISVSLYSIQVPTQVRRVPGSGKQPARGRIQRGDEGDASPSTSTWRIFFSLQIPPVAIAYLTLRPMNNNW